MKPGSRIDGSVAVPAAPAAGENTTNGGGEGQVGESIFVFGRNGASGSIGSGSGSGADASKVLDVTWDRDVGIVSCGEDKRVQINQGSGLRGGGGGDGEGRGAATAAV